MSKGKNKDNTPDDDSDIFRQYMKGTKPLHSDQRVPENTTHKPRPKSRRHPQLGEPFTPLQFNADIDANRSLFFHRGGLQQSKLKQLKRGLIPIDARLDLHGQTLASAEKSLLHFIEQAQTSDAHCVLIIHGRGLGSEQGKPVLKQAVNQWLRQLDQVLAFTSAIPAHGGHGSVYVVLRRRK